MAQTPIAALIVTCFISFGVLAQVPAAGRPPEVVRHSRLPVRLVVKDTPEAQKEFDEVYDFMQVEFSKNYKANEDKVSKFAERYKNTSLAFALVGEFKYNDWQSSDRTSMSDEVIALANKAIEFNPASAEGYILRAKAGLTEGTTIDSSAAAKKAVELAPRKSSAMFVRARVAQRFGLYDEAEQWYRKAIAAIDNPRRNADIYLWMARMLLDSGRLREDIIAGLLRAEKAYREAVRLEGGPGSTLKTFELMQFIIQYKKDVSEAIALNSIRDKDNRFGFDGSLLPYVAWSQRYLAGKADKKELSEIEKRAGISPDEAFVRGAKYMARGEIVRAMLKAKVIFNIDTLGDSAEGSCGCTPALIHAVRQGDFDLVKLLVDNGANVNVEDRWKNPPLVIAARDARLEMTEYLLKKGARADAMFSQGRPLILGPLEWGNGKNIPKIVKLLIAAGVDPNLKHDGDAIINAPVRRGRADVVLTMIANGADPNIKSVRWDGFTYAPLQQAMRLRNPEVIIALLAGGADPEENDGIKLMVADLRKGDAIPGEDPEQTKIRMKSKFALDAWYERKASQAVKK